METGYVSEAKFGDWSVSLTNNAFPSSHTSLWRGEHDSHRPSGSRNVVVYGACYIYQAVLYSAVQWLVSS